MIDTPEIDPDRVVAPRRVAVPVAAGAWAGLVACGLAVAVAMLVAGVVEVVSPVDAAGSEFIDHVPRWLKEWAIREFGTNDKLALRIGMWVTIGVLALALGALATRRPATGVIGIVVFGVLGAIVAAGRPGESGWASMPPLLGAAVGAPLLHRLVRPRPWAPADSPAPSRVPLGWDRRRFLVSTGTAAGVAVLAGSGAEGLERRRLDDIEASIPDTLPPVAGPAVTAPTGAGVDLAEPFITPNDDFYRIDTAFSFPRVDLSSWTLDITGMVDRPLRLTYDELLARPQVERMITLCCVSNEVGGHLIGNAVWQGVLLADLLAQAGVQAGAEQLFSTSLDGWTCGFPVGVATDGRDAMVVVGMNGEPLPLAHGFPVRLAVPGLYGYVSATKWLSSIELTTWDTHTGYWVPRGWSRLGPVKTQSRIDVPRRGEGVTAGDVTVAGVAWAQHRGVERVEVRVDDGPWQDAALAATVSDDTWVQWSTTVSLPAGKHRLQVRATDKDGATQTEDVAPPAPDGATGYHTRTITAS